MQMNKQSTEYSLLTDQILLEHIFKQLHKPLMFYAYKFIKDEDIAKDMVQDAFLCILKRQYNEPIENLKTFLYKCVRNNCINYINHRIIEAKYQEEAIRIRHEIEYFDTHQSIIEKEMYQTLMNAIEELPAHYKIPFNLSRFDHLTNKEIAEKLDLPVRTVETKIYRALTILRNKFDKNIFSFFWIKCSSLNLNPLISNKSVI